MTFSSERGLLSRGAAQPRLREVVYLLAFQVGFANLFAQPATPLALKPVDLKLLLLTGNGTEPSFLAMQTFLNQIGIPHDDVILAPPGGTAVTLPALSNSSKGLYQGIILATGDLGVCDATGVCTSALSAAGWTALDAYATTYGIRVLSYYTYPSTRYGLVAAGTVNTSTTPTNLTFTSAAGALFPYLNVSNPVQVTGAYVYLANAVVAAGETTTPVLSMNGATVGVLHTSASGEQFLALTFDNNPNLVHSLALNYGLINWVTKGVFIGARQIYLTPQADDLFIANELYDAAIAGCQPPGFLLDPTVDLSSGCPTGQVSGADLTALAQWEDKLHASPQTAGFLVTLAFNGVGAADGSGVDLTDNLVSAAMSHAAHFFWVSHTYDHENLDCYDPVPNSGICTPATGPEAAAEIDSNVTIANALQVNLDRQSMVTPSISGLSNPAFIGDAVQRGIMYLIADSSALPPNTPPPNTGLVNTISNTILEIPRIPTSIFYNAITPNTGAAGSETDEYNYFYGPQGIIRIGGVGGPPFFTTNQTYSQILNTESNALLVNMLRYSADPFMFHQSNLVRYDGVNSLLTDLMTQTLQKFTKLSNLPVTSLPENEIGQLFQQRMDFDASGVQATWYPGSPSTILLTATNAATIPITGFCQTGCQAYGGQTIAHVPASAGQSVTVQGLNSSPAATTSCAGATSGFGGCYYNNLSMSGTPALTEMDNQINFTWGNTAPPGLKADDFSVHWDGNINFIPGIYTFNVTLSGTMQISIDGTSAFNYGPTKYATPIKSTFSFPLSGGPHKFSVNYYANGSPGSATAQLGWQP